MKSVYELGGAPKEISQYVVAGEKIVFATRRHWAQIIEPVATAFLGLLLIVFIGVSVKNAGGTFLNVLFLAWLIVLLRAVVYVALWWSDWFIATTSRLLLSYGIIFKKVAMMPLAKVTDMSYNRTVPGRILGYGQFVMESAGQDQALREISFVPNSSEIYRQICSEIFHKKVANQVHTPVAMLGRKHRLSDERGFEPWEQGQRNLDVEVRQAAQFPDTPSSTTTQEIDVSPPQRRLTVRSPREFDDDEDDYDD